MKSRQLFMVGLVLVAVVLSGSILVGFQLYKETVSSHHGSDIDRSTQQVRSELDTRLAGHEQTLEIWAKNPAVAEHGEPSQRAALKTFRNTTAFSGASVIASNGTMTSIVAGLSDTRRRNVTGSNFSDRRYFQQAMEGRTYVSAPFKAQSGNYIVTISTPIRREGELVGTLNGAFHLSEESFFAPTAVSLGPTKGLTIRAESGEIIYASRPTPATDLVVRNATLQETGWTVRVSESKNVIQPTIRRLTYLQFSTLLVVLASILGFGWWNYRRNLQQVDQLLDGFTALESRRYGAQIDVDGSEEWRRIGTGFNRMSRTLERYITERKERQRQLQIVDRMLRHNLRNDMNVIRGRAETIRREESESAAEQAHQIIETSDGLLSMVDKERIINKVLKDRSDPEEIRIDRVVTRAVTGVRKRHPEATVDVDCPDDIVALAVVQIEMAISELVENAIVHNDSEAPAVTVTVTSSDEVHRIAIADNGPGIPEMERRILTDNQDIEPLSHSHGLGLWLVYWIVNHSDGTLRFETADPRGSVVTLELQHVGDAAD